MNAEWKVAPPARFLLAGLAGYKPPRPAVAASLLAEFPDGVLK